MFSLRLLSKGYLVDFGQKSHFTVRSGDFVYLYDGYIPTTGWRSWHMFDVVVQNFHLTLWRWPSTF